MLTLELLDKRCEAQKELSVSVKKYASLFKEAVGKEECYKDSLGWLCTQQWAGEEMLDHLQSLADNIRKDADVFVLIGVGGSNNAARSVIEALKPDGAPEIVYAGNTLSPGALNQVLKKIRGRSIYIDCIAKNFETLEPGSSFRILRQYMYEAYGPLEAARRIIATGTKGSLLEKLCQKHGYTFLEFPLDVGGRYTAVTSVGLLPMAVAGIPIHEVVRGAAAMENEIFTVPIEHNISFKYAALRHIYYKKGYALEMLASFEPQFRWFYKWWIQLFAESEGKDGRGLFPVCAEYSEELHAVGQFVQEGTPLMFETFLTVKDCEDSLIIKKDGIEDAFDYINDRDFKDINRIALNATVKAHMEKLPCLILEADRLDAFHFGQLFYFFMFSCYLSAKLLGVDPFDQPGVEAYKKRMFDGLGKK